MKTFTNFLLTLIILFAVVQTSPGQGCVAIRSVSGLGSASGGGALLQKNEWQAGMNFRYFESFRHFRGAHEETHRIEEGSQVINDSYFLDLTLTYAFTDRLYGTVILPFVYHERSSMYEHGGNPREDDPATPENEFREGKRHKTYAQGIADMRISAGYWLLDPEKHHKSNLSAGLGIKLPTGDWNAQDTYYNQGDERNQTVVGAVDQSIQPGDGGVGISFELQGYHMITHSLIASAYFYYLANPRNVATVDGRSGKRDYSVPDQYAVRLGASYMLPVEGVSLYFGGRREAVPSSDLIGKEDGFRRPGFVMSLEPGISYARGRVSGNFTVPIAFERNRVRSYPDKQSGGHGDAAFADYLINFGITYRFGVKQAIIEYPELPE